MASIDNALTTLSRSKSYLDITGTAKDLILTMLILAASKYVEETKCHRKFKRQTFTNELYNGKGPKRLWLKNPPIISGQTLTLQERVNTANDGDWDTVDSEDYFVDYDKGCLTMVAGVFAEGVQNYRVTYTGGYYLPSASEYQDGTNDDQDLPYDLELAVLDLVSAMYTDRNSGGIAREKVGQVEVEYVTEAAEDPVIKRTLDKYARPAYA